MATSTILDRYGYPYKYAQGAIQDSRRGPVYPVRSDDIDKLIPANDLRTLRHLSAMLYQNMGVPKACLDQIASYSVGEAFLPTYTGMSDFADGKLIANRMRSLWFPNCTTIGGPFDWWKLLEITSVAMDRDGDNFWLFVKGQDGFPRIQIVAANRCGSAEDSGSSVVSSGKYKGLKIQDGIIKWPGGRPAAYRILTSEDFSKYIDVPAESCVHNFDPDYCDQSRGIPKFTHAIQDLISCISSNSDERVRMQLISRMYLTIFNESGGPDLEDPRTAMQAKDSATGAPEMTVRDIPGGLTYMTAGTGEKMEQVKHDNPGDIWNTYQDRLIRMAIVGAKWSYSMWKPSGQGTAERGEVVKMRDTVRSRHRTLRRSALRALSWAYSVFNQNGIMPELDHPFSWSFSKPPRLSVDDGRESKMELEEWRAGVRNTDEILEARGTTCDEFDERRARIIANRKVTARRISEEVSKSSGYQIEIEDREMAMLTPNEVAETDQSDTMDENQPSKPNEDSQD